MRVRASLRGANAAVDVVGTIQFTVADPVSPRRTVGLTAALDSQCLIISPSNFEFGTVQRNCNSPTRGFQVLNSCVTNAVINSTAISLGAGQPAGGPNCPGTAACPEFFVINGIANNTQVLPGSSTAVSFSTKYHPIDDGADQGAYALSVTQAGRQLSTSFRSTAAATSRGSTATAWSSARTRPTCCW